MTTSPHRPRRSGFCAPHMPQASHQTCPRQLRNGDGTTLPCECPCGHPTSAEPDPPAQQLQAVAGDHHQAGGLGPVSILNANAVALPLPDRCVDLVVTSPPYFALRSYTDGGAHYPGQIGSEAAPQQYLDALLHATQEMMRVLKPTGSLFINLGDKYAAAHGGRCTEGAGEASSVYRNRNAAEHWAGGDSHPSRSRAIIVPGIRPKTLMGMPWRYALACIDELGLILRAEIIWNKPNSLPESVTDRVRRSHETWFHFTLQPRYYAAVDHIREPAATDGYGAPRWQPRDGRGDGERRYGRNTHTGYWDERDHTAVNPLGKLPGSVRDIPSAPLTVPEHLGVDHYAAFPPAWPAWIIRGWTPPGICARCGEGRRPVTTYTSEHGRQPGRGRTYESTRAAGAKDTNLGAAAPCPRTITGYRCDCPTPDAPTRPAVVLDPFGGTGTTAMAARAIGRHGITVDLSADYCRIAEWRCHDRDQLAAVRGLPRTSRNRDVDQASLFDLTRGDVAA